MKNLALSLASLLIALLLAELTLRWALFSGAPIFTGLRDAATFSRRVPDRDGDFSREHFLLNYGVGGFGLDQIALLFDVTVDRFDNPLVIFSLLTTDLDRSLLTFRDAQKPYYVLERGQLSLRGTPITLSTAEFVRLNPPQIGSYLFNLARNSATASLGLGATTASEIKFRSQTLNARILEQVLGRLAADGLDHLILVFHPEHHRPDDWRLVFLREQCASHGLSCLFDEDIRTADARLHEGQYDPFRYALPNDGHPTSDANRLVARELQALILGHSPAQAPQAKASE